MVHPLFIPYYGEGSDWIHIAARFGFGKVKILYHSVNGLKEWRRAFVDNFR
jgi:hypothetical protein